MRTKALDITEDAALRLVSKMRVDVVTGCWEWTGAKDVRGYGRASGGLAHRLAYTWFVGPIPAGLVIDHLCRNHGCIRPDHLEPVTQAENLRRGNLPQSEPKDLCHKGHPRGTTPSGNRVCRTCDNQRTLRRYYENKGK